MDVLAQKLLVAESREEMFGVVEFLPVGFLEDLGETLIGKLFFHWGVCYFLFFYYLEKNILGFIVLNEGLFVVHSKFN